MRPILRLSLILLALFLAITPVMTFAQSAGTTSGSSTTTTTNSAPGGSTTMTAPGSSTTDKTTNSDGTVSTTTSTTTSNVPWLWIIVGAIVVIGIIGIVAANGRNTTRIVS